MSAFDRIIGYDTIKSELKQITDMIYNRSVYTEMGAKLPQGLMLYGNPGLGKTMMAKAFLEESRLPSYIIRRNKSSDDFINLITQTFQEAKANAPAVVFLDDIDKFANEDYECRDAEEYVAVQAGIDDVKNCDVFVLATANDEDKLPRSLMRSGRFDRKIKVQEPSDKDAAKIIAHYLSTKKVSDDINMEDLSCMISYSSCAQLECILNDAAIAAAYARKPCIGMDELVQSVLRTEYESPDDCINADDEEIQKIALHEAGHLVVCEVLCPGSVGLASLRASGHSAAKGFVHKCKELKKRSHDVLVSLAGKTAVELYYADTCASGCVSDITRAFTRIREGLSLNATHGFGILDVTGRGFPKLSQELSARSEAVTQAELEQRYMQAKNILLVNRDFLESARKALTEKKTLLHSDIQRIRESVNITEVAV